MRSYGRRLSALETVLGLILPCLDLRATRSMQSEQSVRREEKRVCWAMMKMILSLWKVGRGLHPALWQGRYAFEML